MSGNYAAKANEELTKAETSLREGDPTPLTRYHLDRAQVYATMAAGQIASRQVSGA